MDRKILTKCVFKLRLSCIDHMVLFYEVFINIYFFYEFHQVVGAKVINLTLTIINKECDEDDQSFWQKLKEAVTDNPFFNLFISFFIYLFSSLCVQVIPVGVQSSLL